MREESHLDDMRSAIRGDFERLAERRGSQELMRARPGEEEVGAEEEPIGAPIEEGGPAARSWLVRLLSR